MKALKSLMKKYGFVFKRFARGHQIWTDGRSSIVVSGSPSCSRAIRNIEGDLRRAARKRAG